MNATYPARRLLQSPLKAIQFSANSILAVLLLGSVLRLAIGAWNSFIHPTLSAGRDALEFHKVAVLVAQGAAKFEFLIGWVYAQALGQVYIVTGPHIFVACLLSTVTWLLSAYVLLVVTRRLEFPPQLTFFIAGIYAFLPSSAFITSIPLREACQLLFVNLMALGLLDMFDSKRTQVKALITFVGGATLAGLLHGVFIIVGITAALVAASALLFTSERIKPRVFASIAALVVFVVYSSFAFNTYSYGAMLSITPALELTGSDGSSVLQFRTRAHPTFATYSTRDVLDKQGSAGFVEVVTAVIQYLFEPMPWRQLRLLDYPAVAENAFRAAMLVLALCGLFRLDGAHRLKLLAILALYCCIEGLWAIGTSNWGTALRHHGPSWGLLLMSGSYFLVKGEGKGRARTGYP